MNSSEETSDEYDIQDKNTRLYFHRRNLLKSALLLTSGAIMTTNPLSARAQDTDERLDVDSFLRTGQVANPMGVSSQAGKSKPQTGVFLREGSEVNRDSRSGLVSAEIVVGSTSSDPISLVTSYISPWSLASGTVFDVECRDAKTGDGAFLAVTEGTKGKLLTDIPSSFFLEQIMKPTGRFSFYGSPTDVKLKKDTMVNNYRFIELNFSTLSQSTQTEIPRKAIIATTIVPGTENAVMLVGSATSSRWKKGAEEAVTKTVESFRVAAAPKTSMKVRAKSSRSEIV